MSVVTDLKWTREQLGELVEHGSGRRSLDEFRKYADDPVGFIRNELGEEPFEAQAEIAVAVRDDTRIVVRSCNALGKDWIAARLAMWFALCREGYVIITGPTERQVKQIIMLKEVANAWRALGGHDLPADLLTMSLRVHGNPHAGILAFTSSEASRLTGFHAPRVMVVATEAQGVPDFAYEAMRACATGDEDKMLFVGNPLTPEGEFFQICRSPRWKGFALSALDHPNLTGGRHIPGGPTRVWVEEMRSRYGEGSSIYRSRVLGEFPESSDEALVLRSWLDRSAALWKEIMGDGRSTDPHVATLAAEAKRERRDPTIAIDVARYGPDFSCLAVRTGPLLRELILWNKCDTMETVERAEKELRRLKCHPRLQTGRRITGYYTGAQWETKPPRGRILVDEIGLGAGVLDRLKEKGWKAEGFSGAKRPIISSSGDLYANRRAEAFWKLRELLEDGQIALPPDEDLFSELMSLHWLVNPSGKIQIEPKDEFKNRIGRSPDRADAVSMAFAPLGVSGYAGIPKFDGRAVRWSS